MNGQYLNKLLSINAKHSLYREDGKWYHSLNSFPGVLFDKNGYLLFETKEHYLSHPLLQHKKDLHIKDGISTLTEYRAFTREQKGLIGGLSMTEISIPSEETIRRLRVVDLILRNKILAEKLKKIYNYTCQMCGIKLEINENTCYAEAHHIIPLGRPFNGRDHLENMICVCPNHHVLLDFKAIPLHLEKFKLLKHDISTQSVMFHNSLHNKKNVDILL